jgi:hypothetical protein
MTATLVILETHAGFGWDGKLIDANIFFYLIA